MVKVKLLQDKLRGQAAIVIALSMLFLVLIVGLAIDGGSMYQQRRAAQNSSDAAALAGTRAMLAGYDEMILAYPYDVDGTPQTLGWDLDAAINLTITNFANLHGVNRSDLEAYYVNDDKQIVSNQQVGQLGYVPWASAGAKGITVRNKSATKSWFMGVFGWNSVSAKASSTAFMGIAVDSARDLRLLPVGMFTDTEHMQNMSIGQTYTLIQGDMNQSSGNWGYIDFNGEGGSRNVNNAWMECGYNPTILTQADWNTYCPTHAGTGHSTGPTLMYQCLNPSTDPTCSQPDLTTPLYVPYVKYGPGTDGWWLKASSGATRSSCDDLAEYVLTNQHYMVPMFDYVSEDTGSNTLFHLIGIARFQLVSTDIDCHYVAPTPTPEPSATPCSGGGCPGTESQTWFIQGTLEGFYSTGTGRHGDIRHTSGRIVFLDN